MSLDDKAIALREKHKALETAIEQQVSRPHPNENEVAILKKQKLRIKDELASISR